MPKYIVVVKGEREEVNAICRERGFIPMRFISYKYGSTTLVVQTELDSVNKLNYWVGEVKENPYPIGSLLFWNPDYSNGNYTKDQIDLFCDSHRRI